MVKTKQPREVLRLLFELRGRSPGHQPWGARAAFRDFSDPPVDTKQTKGLALTKTTWITSHLTQEEIAVCELRYCTPSERKGMLSHREIGGQLGMGHTKVARLLTSSLRKVRHELEVTDGSQADLKKALANHLHFSA